MSSFSITDSSESERSNPVRGKKITSTLHPFITSHLRGSIYDWFELKYSECTLDMLRSESVVCFRQLKKNKFELVKYPTAITGLLIYEYQISDGIGCGSGDYKAPDGMRGSMGPTYINEEPTVLITSPKTGIEIDLNDKVYIKKNIKEHTAQEGETAKSIVNTITGKPDLSKIIEMKPKAYHIGDTVLSGYILKIENGLSLKITGAVENSATVELTITGAIVFSETVPVPGYNKTPPNTSYGWGIDIPLPEAQYGLIKIEAKAGNAISISELGINKPNWVDIEYKIDGQSFHTEAVVILRFKDGTTIRGKLNNGLSHFPMVPFMPFSVEFLPTKEKEKELDELYSELDTLLIEKLAEAKKESELVNNIYEKLPWFIQNKVNEFYTVKGAGHWVVDTVTGIAALVYGAAKVIVQSELWLAEYHLHHAKMGACTIAGNQECVKYEAEKIKSMLEDVGEDVGEFTEIAKTFYYLANDGKTVKRLEQFAKEYFRALSVPEQHQFVTRYGIDIALLFVAGSGGLLLGIKNASKVTEIIKSISAILKTFPTKLKFKKPKESVNSKNSFPSKNKKTVIVSREQALIHVRNEAKALGVEIRSGKEAEEYLDFKAKLAGTKPENYHASAIGDDLIMVRNKHINNPRILREELLRTQQQKVGFEISNKSTTNSEIEVREKMITNRNEWGLTNNEIQEMIQDIKVIKERGFY